jgi:hypothetical protein
VTQVLHTLEQTLSGLFRIKRGAERYRVGCPVRLPVGVSMENERIDPEAERYPEPIRGRTSDVSATGLSFFVPWLNLGDERIDVLGYPLRVVLSLPTGVIILHAETVHCRSERGDGGLDGYVVGARITRMNEFDRRRYDDFLATLN